MAEYHELRALYDADTINGNRPGRVKPKNKAVNPVYIGLTAVCVYFFLPTIRSR